jgi:hypothetical protein
VVLFAVVFGVGGGVVGGGVGLMRGRPDHFVSGLIIKGA